MTSFATKLIAFIALVCFFAACSTQYELYGHDGKSFVKGSTSNGGATLCEGPACIQTVAAPGTAIPVAPTPALAQQAKLVCDPHGQHCQAMMMSAPEATPEPTYIHTVTVNGTAITTYFGWVLAGLAAAAVAVLSGS